MQLFVRTGGLCRAGFSAGICCTMLCKRPHASKPLTFVRDVLQTALTPSRWAPAPPSRLLRLWWPPVRVSVFCAGAMRSRFI